MFSSDHPPLPPTQEGDRIARLRLLRSYRVGITTYYRLLAEHGDARTALEALPEVARAAGIDDYRPCPAGTAEAELAAGKAAGARLVMRGDADWPEALAELPDPPPMFWTLGDPTLLGRRAIALVGARSASSLGTRMARRLAGELGEAGFVIVSGLARGVDAASHGASLDTGTIAVQGGGLDKVYPAENADLAKEIAERGLRLSEQPMGQQPQARHFPARNRLIAGLARAVVVIEAAARSGSLITARNALDLGREVLAVPGHPMDGRAAGGNMLIRDGAILVRGAEDVVQALTPIAGPSKDACPDTSDGRPPHGAPAKAVVQETADGEARDGLRRRILETLGPSPVAEDQLLRDLAVAPREAGPALVDLELEGRIVRQAGGLLSRCA